MITLCTRCDVASHRTALANVRPCFIISRMIKNESLSRVVVLAAVLGVATAAGCQKPDLTDGRYQGMIELEQTDLGFEVAGRLAELRARPGQKVKAGDVIATLDDTLDRGERAIRAQELEVARAELALVEAGARIEDVRAARAQLEAARASYAVLAKQVGRERELLARGAVAAAHLDELEAQLAQALGQQQTLEERVRLLSRGARAEELARARARVAQAQDALALSDSRLGKRVLVAPSAGQVLDTYLELGEIAAAGAPIATVIDRSRPYADVFVPVAEVPLLRVGDALLLAVEGLAREVPATVERIFPHAEFTPRYVYSPRERPNLMVRVRARIDDRAGALAAGLPAYARRVTAAARAQ